MKKITGILMVALMCATTLSAQKASVVNGVWDRATAKEVKMFKINNGNLSEVASSKVADDGKFSMSFAPEWEGYYVLGVSPSNMQNRYVFYLKPGDPLNVHVKQESYELTGVNTPENKAMTNWHDFLFPLEDKAVYFQGKNSTYVDFFPLLEEKLEALKSYKPLKTPNKKFNRSFADYRKFSLTYEAIMFLYTARSAHPQGEDFIDFYRHLDIPGMTKTTAILNFPAGLSLVMNSYLTSLKFDESLNDAERRAVFANPAPRLLGGEDNDVILNDTIKGEIAIQLGAHNKSLAGFDEYKKKYEKYIVTDGQRERWNKIETYIKESASQAKTIDFTFPDATGKEVSLSAFRGKVVYIDIWATWCGPCKREFPHMKKLEEEYKDNPNIVFMGISVDTSKQIDKWKKFLVDEKLPGVQLFAGDMAGITLSKPYNITGIPRFMLVGKDGTLLFMDAPRPSSPEIRAILNDAIKK